MKVLAFDTCCGVYSIAIMQEAKLLSHYASDELNQQSSQLIMSIQNCMTESGLQFSDLTHIAVSIGPGSFTGIRIGLAAAQGLALALNIPVVGITTLEALAHGITGKCLTTLEAGKQQYYTQKFFNGKESLSPELLSAEEIDLLRPAYTVVGSLGSPISSPDARSIAEIAITKITSGEKVETPTPLYIREPDAKVQNITFD